ncbi:anti-sigma-X factor RsiX [Paraliobacillus ryukyuensis]|uniref:Sporulation and spore germination protein n=1 Tax=Paraliobacillus ryukyuensis TaxID=200904 RepID=A0A366EGH1_9BACI|nr:GerMN domain-containing protein [Paraliobacillus ryukyuensis]RBP01502.1 sporulation and spore germination protein [Paraliobacillus ryukyuensis]
MQRNNERWRETDIEKKLTEMPLIQDKQSKEVFFRKVEQQMDKAPKHRWRRWMLPSLTGLIALVLLFLIVQHTIEQPLQITEQSNESDMSVRMDSSAEKQTVSEESSFSGEDNVTLNDVESEEVVIPNFNPTDQSMIHYKQTDQEHLFTIVASDKSASYAIPITLVDPSSTDNPNDYYNRINSFLPVERQVSYGIETFPFDDIVFEINHERTEATMTVPENYSFPEGSSIAHLFRRMLSLMFQSYEIDEVIVQTQNGNPVKLGSYGEITKLDLLALEQQTYKIYQYEKKQPMLVPTQTSESIEQALKAMQEEEPTANIIAPIPKDAEFQLTKTENNLNITFSKGNSLGDNKQTSQMIESILMTAKAFNYDTVVIDLPYKGDKVGNYKMKAKILVPDGVNAITLH